MSLKVFNTFNNEVEDFQPMAGNIVKMYVCGPTVYDKAHVGHAMSAISFDIIRRYLQFKGYQVIHVMNFTDVDDKIINRAAALGVEPLKLSQKYINEWLDLVSKLNTVPAHHYPRVSQVIPDLIEMISTLIDKGFAYELDGDVYYRVQEFDNYGQLSGRSLEKSLSGTRVEVDERKEHAGDFALWKAAKPGEPFWESPWGNGRPGWHIECSVMCAKYLGPQIDIHGGGNDLIFPHHENEIAQSEACFGLAPFSRYWLHNGMLTMRGNKMGKSLGNQLTVEDFLQEYSADVLRTIILTSHYRRPIEFDQEIINNALNILKRLRNGMNPAIGDITQGLEVEKLLNEIAAIRSRFETAMDNNFNTAQAMSHIIALEKAINTARNAGIGGEPFAKAQAEFRELTTVLGLVLQSERQEQNSTPFIQLLLEIRSNLREKKEWRLADAIRNKLAAEGVILEDGADGVSWRMQDPG